jgi:hypothetical protein
MCGLHADGDKADGFKSMVVAQFTGIGLQKDDNAFVKYDPNSGTYKDATFAGNENIHTDSLQFTNQHMKTSILSVPIIHSYKLFLYLQLDLHSTLLLKLVETNQSPTPTLTLVPSH